MNPQYGLREEHYSIIYNVSFLSLGSSMYAMYNGYYGLSIYPGGAFLTSVNYWRKPDYSWRRYLDMFFIKYALSRQLHSAYGAEYAREYYTLTFIAVCFYGLGVYYYSQNLHWHSTYAHCTLHIIANIANVILYSGEIKV
jgi:hypothetical protein